MRALTVALACTLLASAAGAAETKQPQKKPETKQSWQSDVAGFKRALGSAVAAAGAAPDPKSKRSSEKAAAQKAVAAFSARPVTWKVVCTAIGERGPIIKEFVDTPQPSDFSGVPVRIAIGQAAGDTRAWSAVKADDHVLCEATVSVDALPHKGYWYVLVRLSEVKVTVVPPPTP